MIPGVIEELEDLRAWVTKMQAGAFYRHLIVEEIDRRVKDLKVEAAK